MEGRFQLVTTRQLATMLSIPEKTIRNWTWQKMIPHYKIGARVRFDRGEIVRWYEARKINSLSDSTVNVKMGFDGSEIQK